MPIPVGLHYEAVHAMLHQIFMTQFHKTFVKSIYNSKNLKSVYKIYFTRNKAINKKEINHH